MGSTSPDPTGSPTGTPTGPDRPPPRPRWKLSAAAGAVLAGTTVVAIDAGDSDAATNLLGLGLIAVAVFWILPTRMTVRASLRGDAAEPPPSVGTSLGRTVSIPTAGQVTDPGEVVRILKEHGVDLTEDQVKRALSEGGQVQERSITINVPPSGERPSTTITWNGRTVDQAAVRANGEPARARVLAVNDPIPEAFGPDVKLVDLEIATEGAEPRRVHLVPVIVPQGRERELQAGVTVDVRIDRGDPEIVVVDW